MNGFLNESFKCLSLDCGSSIAHWDALGAALRRETMLLWDGGWGVEADVSY